MCLQESGSPQSKFSSVRGVLVYERKVADINLAVYEFEYCYAVSLGVWIKVRSAVPTASVRAPWALSLVIRGL
jgi:hypothetical protein